MKKNVESIFPYGAEIYNEGQINRIGLEIIYMIIPGLSEPPVRTLRFFRNYPFLLFYIIGHIV